jgi:hypothetical protein
MDCILRDIDIELWSKVRVKSTLERKTMREVIFEGLRMVHNASGDQGDCNNAQSWAVK